MKNKVEEILKEHGFIESEFPEVFSAMSEILDAAADRLEETEPYATHSIQRLREMASDVSDIESFIENNS